MVIATSVQAPMTQLHSALVAVIATPCPSYIGPSKVLEKIVA
jgi:hypothetical protein